MTYIVLTLLELVNVLSFFPWRIRFPPVVVVVVVAAATVAVAAAPLIIIIMVNQTIVGSGQVAGTCECGYEPSGSIKCREFLD